MSESPKKGNIEYFSQSKKFDFAKIIRLFNRNTKMLHSIKGDGKYIAVRYEHGKIKIVGRNQSGEGDLIKFCNYPLLRGDRISTPTATNKKHSIDVNTNQFVYHYCPVVFGCDSVAVTSALTAYTGDTGSVVGDFDVITIADDQTLTVYIDIDFTGTLSASILTVSGFTAPASTVSNKRVPMATLHYHTQGDYVEIVTIHQAGVLDYNNYFTG